MRRADLGDNRFAVARLGVDDGDIHFTVQREREAPRNRRCCHVKHMGHMPGFSLELLTLVNAKTMLLIDDNEPQFVHVNLFLNKGVSTHDELCRAVGNSRLSKFLLGGFEAANQQPNLIGIA